MTIRELLSLCDARVTLGDGALEVFCYDEDGNSVPLRVCEKRLIKGVAKKDYEILELDGWEIRRP